MKEKVEGGIKEKKKKESGYDSSLQKKKKKKSKRGCPTVLQWEKQTWEEKKNPTVTIFKCLKNVVWCHDSKARRPSSVISSFWLRSSATSHTGRNLPWAAERGGGGGGGGGGGKGESEKWKSSGLIHCVPSAMHATVPRLMAGRGVRARLILATVKLVLPERFSLGSWLSFKFMEETNFYRMESCDAYFLHQLLYLWQCPKTRRPGDMCNSERKLYMTWIYWKHMILFPGQLEI